MHPCHTLTSSSAAPLRAATLLPLLALAALAADRPARALPPDDDTSAKVTIVEFSDFQCPYCGRAETTLDQLHAQYGDALSVRFVHNPLPFHPRALPAAIAAEAARLQSAFVPYASALFANQRALDDGDLEQLARDLKLDVTAFKAALADPHVAERIARDQRIAAAIGATGTPTFFINGRKLRGAQPIDQFKLLIDDEIAQADKAGRRGPAWVADRLRANLPELADYLSGAKEPPAPAKTQPDDKAPADTTVYRVPVDAQVDAIRGPLTAPVTVVVFADFQCPFCARHHATLDALAAKYGNKLRLVFKHNPLPFHDRALPAAHAALCAKDQGKFWEMHDRLYAASGALADDVLEADARALGLDLGKWKKCVGGKMHQTQIEADIALAADATARGTPNTFVNGRKLVGARPLEDFVAVVDDALKVAEAKLASGVAPAALYPELIKDGKVFEPLGAEVHAFDAQGAPTLGKPTAKVHLVVAGDFQCPFCARLAPILTQLAAKYPTQLAIVWKHFPLGPHPDARPAAVAAICAHEQGKFWAAEAWLFEHQALMHDDLPGLAAAVKLDRRKFDACVASERPGKIIDADRAELAAADVAGTPTLFFGGRELSAPTGYTFEALAKVVDQLLAK